jgi:hypothetical protein
MSDWIYFYTSKNRIKWSIESHSIDHLEKSWGRGWWFFKSPAGLRGESLRLPSTGRALLLCEHKFLLVYANPLGKWYHFLF